MAKEEIKGIVRLIDADVEGTKPLFMALKKIKGVSFCMAETICKILGLPKSKMVGTFSDQDIEKIKDVIRHPLEHNIPPWMLNRQNDVATGKDKHLLSSDLKFTKDFDIKRLKMIKSYRGMRHAFGLPVRGQRTKGHFRKGKTVGVRKKK